MLAFILDLSQKELNHPIRDDLRRDDRLRDLLEIYEFHEEYRIGFNLQTASDKAERMTINRKEIFESEIQNLSFLL
jgi:hypothetical protein